MEDEAQVRREIEGRYDACRDAFMALDADAFAAAFGGDVTHPDVVPSFGSDQSDYFAWRFDRTVQTLGFELVIDTFEAGDGVVDLELDEVNSARVLDADGNEVHRAAIARESARWERAGDRWVQTGVTVLSSRVTIDGADVEPEQDPVGVAAFRHSHGE